MGKTHFSPSTVIIAMYSDKLHFLWMKWNYENYVLATESLHKNANPKLFTSTLFWWFVSWEAKDSRQGKEKVSLTLLKTPSDTGKPSTIL